jgi:4-amino-4-deoxy-L-arabinose transferase-like glycosyltransferase
VSIAVSPIRPAAPVWQLAIESFLPTKARARSTTWVARLPLLSILIFQLLASVRLTNTPYDDEALYINAGHTYIDHWLHGATVPTSFAETFSGSPWGYPVISGVLDDIGGLWLVRAASALLMVVATLALYGTIRFIWGTRCGLLSAAAFAGAGPVLMVGHFATYDSATLACLSGAMWLGITKRSYPTAALTGLLLAAAAVFKYTGAVFLPVVVVLIVVAQVRRVRRALLVGTVGVGALLVLWAVSGPTLRTGIRFTTMQRAAQDPVTAQWMAHYFLLDIGLLALVAAAGVLVTVRGRRTLLLSACLAGGALLLPVAQLRIGEGASFEKHLAYCALFAAPLAGRMLEWVSRRTAGQVGAVALVLVMAVVGLDRSNAMFQWANVTPVYQQVESDPAAGEYLSTSFVALQYYTRDDPQVEWSNAYGVLASPQSALAQSVADGTWQLVALQSGSGDNAALDTNKDYLLQLVRDSPRYELVATVPVQKYSTHDWLIFRLRT